MGICCASDHVKENQKGDLSYPHFALVYIDRDGNLRHEVSRSIAHSSQIILSPQVTSEFLSAVEKSSDYHSSHSLFELYVQMPTRQIPPNEQSHLPHRIANALCDVDVHRVEDPIELQPEPPTLPPSWLDQQEPWARENQQQPKNNPRNDVFTPKAIISIKDNQDFLRGYYEKVFQNLQQANCRIIAKAYVKLVEPRKQINYPYNGRKVVAGRTQKFDPEMTKPPWWPAGVRHREPDHLLKTERIRLLIHILCELRISNGITSQRLRESDQSFRRQIFPVERLQLLDELYEVRKAEERFLEGATDKKTMFSISRANLPDAMGFATGEGVYSTKYTLAEDDPSGRPGKKPRSIHSRPARNRNIQQPVQIVGAEKPADLSLNSDPVVQSSSQHIQRDRAIHPNLNDESGSISASPQDLNRTYASAGAYPHTASWTNSSPCNSPSFMSFQPFLPETYGGLEGFQHPWVPNTGQSGTEQLGRNMETHGFHFHS